MNKILTDSTLTIDAPVIIPRSLIADTLCCALEGGSTYWCVGFAVQTYVEGAGWGHEQLALGGCWSIRTDLDDEWHTIIGSDLRLKEAVGIFAVKYPKHFSDMMGSTSDARTGDILFQLLCFKEVVYG